MQHITFGLLHVHLFLDVSIQKDTFDVKLVNAKNQTNVWTSIQLLERFEHANIVKLLYHELYALVWLIKSLIMLMKYLVRFDT